MAQVNGLNTKGERRAKRKHKEIHGPGGGTMAGFAKSAEVNKGYKKSKRKLQISIIDKTKK